MPLETVASSTAKSLVRWRAGPPFLVLVVGPVPTHHGPIDPLKVLERGEIDDQPPPAVVELDLHSRVEVFGEQFLELEYSGLRQRAFPGYDLEYHLSTTRQSIPSGTCRQDVGKLRRQAPR